jgi:hypothetical protein
MLHKDGEHRIPLPDLSNEQAPSPLAWIAGEQDRPGWLPLFVDFGWEVAWLLGFRGWQ